ncbi:G2/M phase-specific E3 ubiquitin-protein ligase [Anabarilius grahami]|uniref:HECT-type E3 ubiquitin transferase n=1 Tax=Anabarilius grahami TaxID=495550 RepID=A0A3N0XCZ4_ANAGA|nr:G2/M phase-specific E3 ubiquitin-protein ligase [Anabarilius grahami]
MDERAFHQKIREAFPIIGEGEIEICRVDRRRRVIPVELSSVCPAAIKACPEFGRSAVYVRLKDLFAFAGSDDMASEVFRVQLSWSSNTILSTVDGSLLDHEISRPSTLYVLWMSGVQIEDDVTAADIIRTFQRENLNLDERVIVVARRRKILHSACTALKTSYFAWHKSPQIEFVGESADDYGGPSREFFRLLMQDVQSSFGVFEGKTGQMFFNYDQVAVEMKRYFTAGKLIAWSLMHGGSGFKALDSTLFKLMCGQADSAEEFDWHNLPDGEIQDKVRQTQEDIDGIVSSLGDWIADCGVPGIYNAAPKDMRRIYGQVIKHYIYFRTADMICQFKDGMNSCGNLWQIVEKNWKVFLPLFTNEQKGLTRDEFRALFTICWSEEGSNLREREEDTIFCWELLLNSIQEKQSTITFQEMLVFITGADSIPPLGFPGEPRIEFYTQESRRLPFASTCGMVLFLPRGIQEEEELTDLLNTALKGYLGFGKI